MFDNCEQYVRNMRTFLFLHLSDESAAEYYPKASWQLCMVHFHRNVAGKVSSAKVKQVTWMLKAIYASESAEAGQKTINVIEDLRTMKLTAAAELLEQKIDEALNQKSQNQKGQSYLIFTSGSTIGTKHQIQ